LFWVVVLVQVGRKAKQGWVLRREKWYGVTKWKWVFCMVRGSALISITSDGREGEDLVRDLRGE
jgi:hypothetical protein